MHSPAASTGWSSAVHVKAPCGGGSGVFGSMQFVSLHPEVDTHGATVAATVYSDAEDTVTVTAAMLVVKPYTRWPSLADR